MRRWNFLFFRCTECRNYVLPFAFCWVLSIAAGTILATSFVNVPSSLMHSVIISPVSIVGLAVVLFLPVVLSAVAFRFAMSWIIYLTAILKGISFGFSIYFLVISYLNAGWLICCLVMFSGICVQIPLLVFWIRHINGKMQHLKRDVIICLCLTGLIGCVDYFLISPFVITLVG